MRRFPLFAILFALAVPVLAQPGYDASRMA